ncbi:MAG: prepilin-type N-terminal cleavage/methylation domain-containing protein [Lactobacillus sp.]|nr:prepilin-type N-terminal cleavage/methylation domain-containing protein [Lactobacillus sp.]MDN6052045.1 prepilin-type N-terminal cleavage/methylation domain-containing protein [Lactobacillus sp.]
MKTTVKQYLVKLMKKSRRQAGFTLIEMIVVIAIIVMLVLLIAPNLVAQKQRAQTVSEQSFKTTLQTQVDLYVDAGSKEPTFDNLAPAGFLTKNQVEHAQRSGYRIAANNSANQAIWTVTGGPGKAAGGD